MSDEHRRMNSPWEGSDSANLEVTYTDGFVEVIKNVRYQVNKADPNPVELVGGILTVETAGFIGEVWYLVNVRKFRFCTEGE